MRDRVDAVVTFHDMLGFFQQPFNFLFDEFIFIVIVPRLLLRDDFAARFRRATGLLGGFQVLFASKDVKRLVFDFDF